MTSYGMSSFCATNLAIPILQQPRSCHFFEAATVLSSCSHTWSVTPWTSYPWRTSKAAATELSTPPLIPSNTRGPVIVAGIVLGRDGWRLEVGCTDFLALRG